MFEHYHHSNHSICCHSVGTTPQAPTTITPQAPTTVVPSTIFKRNAPARLASKTLFCSRLALVSLSRFNQNHSILPSPLIHSINGPPQFATTQSTFIMLAITLASIAIAASSATAQAITAVPAGSFGNATCEGTFSNVLAMYNKCGYTFNFSSNNPISINGDPAAAIRCICAHVSSPFFLSAQQSLLNQTPSFRIT
ncbi:hypothetical protein BC830DRAFT_945309 [Chytriomyces sp. MP71]|nr:hypothetical protein BC830DRAFT_945309 [Chytriomyces sp. MP71]